MGSRGHCSILGCGAPAAVKGLCRPCYKSAWNRANKHKFTKARRREAQKSGPRATLRYGVMRALAGVERMEERTSQIMHFLGMSAPRLPIDLNSVLLLLESLTLPVEYPRVTSPEYIRYWAGVFFSLNETYLEAVGNLLNSKEPWRPFIVFANRLTRKLHKSGATALARSAELAMAERYLSAGSAHLWYISYMLCRRLHGHDIAGEAFGEKPSAVSEIVAVALLH
jgi:hypothetical protein